MRRRRRPWARVTAMRRSRIRGSIGPDSSPVERGVPRIDPGLDLGTGLVGLRLIHVRLELDARGARGFVEIREGELHRLGLVRRDGRGCGGPFRVGFDA